MYTHDIEILYHQLQAKADPQVKIWWEKYVKQSAPFIGVKMPVIRSVVWAWYQQSIKGNLNFDQQKELALALIGRPYSEEKLAGILFWQEILIPAGGVECDQDVDKFAALFAAQPIYDWNVCDWFCVKVLGPLLEKGGDPCAQAMAEWRNAANLWQARASVVAFVNSAEESNYYPLILKSAEMLIRREERFAKTAVGWILRDISKYDQSFVKAFVADNLAYFSLETLVDNSNLTSCKTQDTSAKALPPSLISLT